MPITVSEKSKVISIYVQNGAGLAATLQPVDYILTKDLSANIGVGDETTDEFDGIDSRDNPITTGNLRNEFSFKFPVSFESEASGGAMIAPKWLGLMRGCGFDVAIDSTAKTYTFTPSPTADLDLLKVVMRRAKNATQDMAFQAYDSRGILGIDLQVKQRPFFTVSGLSGSYIEPVAVAKARPAYGSQTINLAGALGKSTGVDMQLNGKTICASSFTCDNLSGLTLGRDADMCDEFSEAETTTPVASVTFRSPDWTTEFNPFAWGRTDGAVNRYPFSVEIGQTALHTFALECDEVQPVNPADATVGGSTYGNQLGLRFLSPIRIVIK